jgi:hypothetical protein
MAKRRGKGVGTARSELGAAKAKVAEIRALDAVKSTTSEEGKWKAAAEKARRKLAVSFEQPTRSTQRNWKLGKGPSSH